MSTPKSSSTSLKKLASRYLPVVPHDDVPCVQGETLAVISGVLSLNRETAPPALARAALDLLDASRNMGLSGGGVAPGEEEAFDKLKTYTDARPTGLVVYLLAPSGLRAGLGGAEITTIVEEVDRLLQLRNSPAYDVIVATAVATAMTPKPAATPNGSISTKSLMDHIAAAWEIGQ